ncbi:MAG TPA: hypothetical protein VGK23_01340 [Methanomassiliicoccales archaeon]
MVQTKIGCKFCHNTGKVSQVSASGTRTEICFMCHGRGFTIMTIRPNLNQNNAAETTG